MEPAIQYATTSDGASIAYCALGQGAPLAMMPGGPWSPIQDLESVTGTLGAETFALFAPQTAGPVAIAYNARHPGVSLT